MLLFFKTFFFFKMGNVRACLCANGTYQQIRGWKTDDGTDSRMATGLLDWWSEKISTPSPQYNSDEILENYKIIKAPVII